MPAETFWNLNFSLKYQEILSIVENSTF
jgi:hypothetical protein